MEKLYYYFDLEYEEVYRLPNTPYRILLVSVGYVGFHWHSEAEILLVLDGQVRVRNSIGTALLSAGDIMIIKPHELHGLVEMSPNIVLVLQVDEGVFNEDSLGSQTTVFPFPPMRSVAPETLQAIRRDMASMAHETWDQKKGFQAMCLSALHHIIGLLDRDVACPGDEAASKTIVATNQSRIKNVLDYLHTNFAEKISLHEIADHINVSPSYASHLIKSNTGRSMQENLSYIRTGKAVDLLMKTDMKLIEISAAVGFSDPKYFNQYFRRLFRCTPREMKRKPNWRQAILSHYKEGGLDSSYGRPFLKKYLSPG